MEELFNNITDTSVTLLEKENVTELAKSAVIDKSVSIFYFVVKTLKFLNLYYLGAIIVVGVLGNSFNFVSFVRTRNKLRSPSYYLAALALADFVFLAVLFIIWLNQLKINLFEWPIIYEILVYLSAFSSSMSGNCHYIILLFTNWIITLRLTYCCSLARGGIHFWASHRHSLPVEALQTVHSSEGQEDYWLHLSCHCRPSDTSPFRDWFYQQDDGGWSRH